MHYLTIIDQIIIYKFCSKDNIECVVHNTTAMETAEARNYVYNNVDKVFC